jgi:hypothetical protein
VRAFEIAGMKVPPGSRKDLKIRISEFTTATPVFIPVTVLHGTGPGPVLCVTAVLHGDEINGLETVRRLRSGVDPRRLKGTLVLVLIANPISFLAMRRTLPDGRDLNRAFPGRDRGSMASRIAGALFGKVVRLADAVIDLHTAPAGRVNLPHVRADLRRPRVRRLAEAFGAEVTLDLRGEKGTLRRAAAEAGIPGIAFEAGEPLRFQKPSIERGIRGIRNVLSRLGMVGGRPTRPPFRLCVKDGRWIRAVKGGILNLEVEPGDIIMRGGTVAVSSRPFGTEESRIRAPYSGLVVGCATVPMVFPGAAVCHLAPLGRRAGALAGLLRRRRFPGSWGKDA